jgi:hypothetical protein
MGTEVTVTTNCSLSETGSHVHSLLTIFPDTTNTTITSMFLFSLGFFFYFFLFCFGFSFFFLLFVTFSVLIS